MGLLVLTPYKPQPATPGDANQVANGFTAIEAVVNAITQANMGAGNKTTASAMSGGPPASPTDGDIWIALNVDANGTVWQFRYNAGSASSLKWEFIGGPSVMSIASPNVVVNAAPQVGATGYFYSTSYTTVRAGDYEVSGSHVIDPNGALAVITSDLFKGTTQLGEAVGNTISTAAAADFMTNTMASVPVSGVGAGVVIAMAINSGAPGTNKILRMLLAVKPVRIT